MIKNIVVLGCSRGIGYEAVKFIAEHTDHNVIALSRNVSSLEGLKNVDAYSFDLNSDNVREELTAILKNYKQLDVLINNAGTLVNKAFLDLSQEDIATSYQTNIVGIMAATQAFVAHVGEGAAHILNISSVGGIQGSVKFAGLSAYSTSKAALVSFTELFAEEFKDTAIDMNCLCLGAVQTEMLAQAFPGYEAPISATKMAKYIVEFSLTGNEYYKGKILPVSMSTP